MATSISSNIAYRAHNHDKCIKSALATAQHMCVEKGVRLTPLRRQVLGLIWKSHKPLGAYALMDMLGEKSEKSVAPPTIYRALEFLQEQRLIHRLSSLNAFIGCCDPLTDHSSYFFICQHCEVTMEMNHKSVQRAISKTANAIQFQIESESVEVVGLCPNCQRETA